MLLTGCASSASAPDLPCFLIRSRISEVIPGQEPVLPCHLPAKTTNFLTRDGIGSVGSEHGFSQISKEVMIVRRLWAPWRMGYILGDKPHNCVFCEALQANDDAANYVLYRDKRAALMLNRYPYINGHMLVVPYVHIGDLVDLDDQTLADMMFLTRKGVQLLRMAVNPHGFNIGLNLGQAAGAGIQDHIHIHIVPRWENDTNFMPVLSNVRVIPESLDDTYNRLLTALRKMQGDA